MKDLIRQKWMGLAILLFVAYCVYIATAAPPASVTAERANDGQKCAVQAKHWKEDVLPRMASHLQDGAGQRTAAVRLVAARLACESVMLDSDIFRAYDQKIEAMAKQPDVVAEAQNILHK